MLQPWFSEAKLGIFLHWGIYSVNGIGESWSFYRPNRPDYIPYEGYMAQAHGFTARRYDPVAWADLFRRAGARYAVLTSKHHDGMALWDTQLSDLNVAKMTPAGRDLIGPYCEAMRAAGLRVGLYFSHLDWSHPDYVPVPVGERTDDTLPKATFDADLYQAWPEGPASSQWQRFLAFHRGQLEELCTQYGALDLLWFDGDWSPRSDDFWRMAELREQLLAWQPNAVLNSRMGGHGDFLTPEQGIPIVKPSGPWEFNVTLNDSWGYQFGDHNFKPVREILQMFIECLSMGGNMLLGVGPYADGSLPVEAVDRLEALGAWIDKHAEAIYPTVAGLPFGHVLAPTTLSKDNQTIYLYLWDQPRGPITIKGIRNTIRRISVVGSDVEVSYLRRLGAHWMNIPGVMQVDVPSELLDPLVTVVKLELEGELDLYRGAGAAIDVN